MIGEVHRISNNFINSISYSIPIPLDVQYSSDSSDEKSCKNLTQHFGNLRRQQPKNYISPNRLSDLVGKSMGFKGPLS